MPKPTFNSISLADLNAVTGGCGKKEPPPQPPPQQAAARPAPAPAPRPGPEITTNVQIAYA